MPRRTAKRRDSEKAKVGEKDRREEARKTKPKKRSKLSNMPQAGLREGEGNGG